MYLGALLAVVVFGHLTRPFTRHFHNSVLASLSILYLAFPGATVRLVQPFVHLPAFSVTPVIQSDAAVEVGVLSLLKGGDIPADADLTHFLAGVTPGGIGSVSVLLLVTGGLYLFVRRVISWQVPLCFAFSAAALFYLFSPAEDAGLWMLYQIFSGGIPLALIFFGNDPDSTPVTRTGKVIFGILCGVLTALFRLGTPLVEGVGFAVILASLLSRPLDILFRPRVYGKKRDLWRILSEISERIKGLGTKLPKKEKDA